MAFGRGNNTHSRNEKVNNMDQNVMGKGQPELHNEELEQDIRSFTAKQDAELMGKILQRLAQAQIMQPAVFPVGTNPEELKKLVQNGPAKTDLRPQPLILKSKDGDNFLPIFTSPAQLPKEQKYPAVIFVPFIQCVKAAVKESNGLKGIVVNPFTDNLVVHQPALQMLDQRTSAPQKVTLTGPQMMAFLRGQVELGELPRMLHKYGAAAMDDLTEQKGDYVVKLYEEAYSKVKGMEDKQPYRASNFEIMSLNISDDLRMVEVTMPSQKILPGQVLHAFMFLNPETGDSIYYAIRKAEGSAPNELGIVQRGGMYESVGEAPEEGSELYTLMGMLPWKQ